MSHSKTDAVFFVLYYLQSEFHVLVLESLYRRVTKTKGICLSE